MNQKVTLGIVVLLACTTLVFWNGETLWRTFQAVPDEVTEEKIPEVVFIGFDGVPEVVGGIQETINKDNREERRLGPGPFVTRAEILSYERKTWDNSGLADAPVPGTYEKGVYPGYLVRLNIDGELQEWRISEDGRFGTISAGLGQVPQ